jgi:hypothetical protein
VVGSYEHCNEQLGFVKRGEFLVQLSDCWQMPKDPSEALSENSI